jgi:predicted nucleic acid-binding Zn ribbon protein
MTEPSPEACEVCGAGPLAIVLHPVAVHYKGSGFYSTDYGKGAKKKDHAGATSSSDGSVIESRDTISPPSSMTSGTLRPA